MNEIKVQNFSKEHPDIRFPGWRSLSAQEAAEIRAQLAHRIGAREDLNEIALTRLILDRGIFIKELNALDVGFSLCALLANLDIVPRPNVFLNWHHFDDIDQMRLEDVDKFFEYLWYPSADDLDLFDDSLSWLLSISHDGDIKIARDLSS